MSKPKYVDWEEIKTAFIVNFAETGRVDLKPLAEKFNVSYGTLRNKAADGKWRDQAESLREEANIKVREEILPDIIERRRAAYEEHLTWLRALQAKALKFVQKMPDTAMTPNLAMRTLFDSMRLQREILDTAVAEASGDSSDLDLAKSFDQFVQKFATLANARGPEPVLIEGRAVAVEEEDA